LVSSCFRFRFHHGCHWHSTENDFGNAVVVAAAAAVDDDAAAAAVAVAVFDRGCEETDEVPWCGRDRFELAFGESKIVSFEVAVVVSLQRSVGPGDGTSSSCLRCGC